LLKVMGAGFKRKKSEKVRSLIQLTDWFRFSLPCFELRASCLLARTSTTWPQPQPFFALVIFWVGSCLSSLPRAGLGQKYSNIWILGFHLTSVRMTIITKTNNKCWWGGWKRNPCTPLMEKLIHSSIIEVSTAIS
jgi:hypothetical protein